MRPYAERPLRVASQVLADLLVVGWVLLCVQVALAVRAMIEQLQAPGRTLADAGDAIRGAFEEAARTAAGVPFVGEDLARALGTGAGAGESVATAGRQTVDAVAVAAAGTAIGIVAVGALPVVALWLTLRVRWMLRARSARAVRDVDTDLLALRALTRLPVQRLRRVCVHPAAAWRRGDPDTIGELAALELRSLGLRPPAPAGFSRSP